MPEIIESNDRPSGDIPPLPIGNDKHRRRRRRKGKKLDGNETDKNTDNPNNPMDKPTGKSKAVKSKKNSRRRRTDRYFGRFHCRVCDRTWESAHVYTRAGTLKVLWKQRCKQCTGDEAWVFPYKLQLIICSECDQTPCVCICEDCGKLKHRPKNVKDTPLSQDLNQKSVEYCRCKKKRPLGDNIDLKKPHRKDLCERCLKGLYCTQAQNDDPGRVSDENDATWDNEP